MNKAVIIYGEKNLTQYENILKMLQDIFAANHMEAELLGIDKEHPAVYYTQRLKQYEDAILCSLDMAGFQYGTLLGDYLYNILPSMQMHLVFRTEFLPDYEGMELALNSFLFVPEGAEEWKKHNSQILNLSTYTSLQTQGGEYLDNEYNRNILKGMAMKIIEEKGQ